MRRTAVLLVFCFWPVLNFVNHNKEQLGVSEYLELLSFFALAAFVTVAPYVLSRLVFRQSRQSNTIAALVALTIIFFNYHIISRSIDRAFSFLGWQNGRASFYLFLLLVVPLVALWTCNSKVVVDALLVAGLAGILFPVLTLSTYFLTKVFTKANVKVVQADYLGHTTNLRRSPNIYYIMTDGYARQDQLVNLFRYDNSPFLGYLKANGFYVADEAYSNYPQTFLSFPTSLWMDYPVTETTPTFSDRHRFYSIIQGHNPVVRYLKAHGYSYLHMGVGRWAGSKCGGNEDLCLTNNDALRVAFYSMTPVAYFKRPYAITTAASLEQKLDRIAQYRVFFLLAHLQPPHPPASFDKNCQDILAKPNDVNIWGESRKPEYLNDLRCTNQQLIRVIDRIVFRDPQAIIVLHSDHGTAYGIDWRWPLDQWPRKAFEQRFPILMALRLPTDCRESLYPSLSPVNIFRVTFACLEGTLPEVLADVSYISSYEKTEEFGRVHKYER